MLTLDPIWTPLPQQRVARALIAAFAEPGTVHPLDAYLGGDPAWLGALAALLDPATALHDHAGRVAERQWRLLAAPRAALADAPFVLADGGSQPDADFAPRVGTLLAPEHGATLILIVTALGSGPSLVLRGPGVDGERRLGVSGLHPGWIARRAEWNAEFPLGVDLLLADHERIAAIPRTTIVRREEG